jgi:hypothetical protein
VSDRKKKRGLGLLDEVVAALPHDALQELKSAERVKRQQEYVARAEGFGATAAGQAIAENWLPTLIEGIERTLAAKKCSPLYVEFLDVRRAYRLNRRPSCVAGLLRFERCGAIISMPSRRSCSSSGSLS